MNAPPQHVVVIGGGYGGTAVLSRLCVQLSKRGESDRVRVTLIEPKDSVFLGIASPRVLVDETTAFDAFVPYNDILRGSCVTHLRHFVSAVDLDAQCVLFDDGAEPLTFDVLVLATGVTTDRPFRFDGRRTRDTNDRREMMRSTATFHPEVLDTEQLLQRIGKQRKKLAAATRVIVVGGGATGIETACEVKQAHPLKDVKLVHAGARLMEGVLSVRDSQRLLRKVQQLGVVVALGTRYEDADESKSAADDYVIRAMQGTPNTQFLPSHCLDERGFVLVNDSLQLHGHSRVFVLGDSLAGHVPNVRITRCVHAPVVVANVMATLHGSAEFAALPARPAAPSTFSPAGAIVVTLGRHDAFTKGLGVLVARQKCKDMFISRQRRSLLKGM